jgi:hypothetical protein
VNAYITKYLDPLINGCLCDASAPCNTDCTAWCADTNQSVPMACTTCLNGLANTEPCVDAVLQGCGGDAACSSMAQLIAMCPDS